ncbi:MAG TPA: bifunctional (p)ppGpp synthetase/guanosine-3',5'-bis(diphosphate) 3'-pyrophosphohydrolase [bacterium]|nr:bifunctional (p)ppGpp synthetase/guanosine-3',5'-bis(diphosphate) 3'-pyrophosphohydrolase [bacterium]
MSTNPLPDFGESPPIPEKILHYDDLVAAVGSERRDFNFDLLRRAYDFAEKHHEGQIRRSGDPYLHHCVSVAAILAELNLDATTIAAGLLHDILEDTQVSYEELRSKFGEAIASIVNGVSKIGGIKFSSPEEHQAENWRKMLLSIAQDIRVILIKLADRLHNMRTIQYLPEDRRTRIAQETLDIYAPLAHRFGIAAIRWELEDHALKTLEPEAYNELVDKVAMKRETRQAYLDQLVVPLRAALDERGIRGEVAGRPKHFYSIYRKMKMRQKRFEEIYDLLAVRVIVPTATECYEALGMIHSQWTPIPDRIKDFIANPKSNHYRSLHTTVVGPGREWVEFQIRTPEMHAEAEFGIAAHWAYKEGEVLNESTVGRFPWIGDLVKEQADHSAEEFLDLLKSDLFQHEVFVFTPKGELKVLPRYSTPIDFAYLIHTEIGNHCVGARVNGKIVPLRYQLQNGDTIEIITSPMGKPSQDWLNFIVTSGARGKIRRHFRIEHMQHSISLGKEMLEREGKRRHVEFDKAINKETAKVLGFDTPEKLYAAVGLGDISSMHVVRKLFPEAPEKEKETGGIRRILTFTKKKEGGVRVQGVSNILIRFAQCCQPLPGEAIVGIVTRGRGISVHRLDCPNTFPSAIEADRRVAVAWDVTREDSFQVRLFIEGENRRGLLADVSAAFTGLDTNILSGKMEAEGHRAIGKFLVEVQDLAHLQRVLRAVRKVKGVTLVSREDNKGENA